MKVLQKELDPSKTWKIDKNGHEMTFYKAVKTNRII